MSILDDLKSLDPNDPGRWPLAVRAAFGALCFLILSGVWGSTYLARRVAVETVPPFVMGAIRFSIAGLVMIGL